jgi:broad-specificity NMP kinase
MSQTIYIFSGPCGAGKSTITKGTAEEMEQVVLLEGDTIFSMFAGKTQPPWEEALSIVWSSILALTRNFIQSGLDVMIDYVVEDELAWFSKQVSDLNVDIIYVVLRADQDTLVERLKIRGDTDLIDRTIFLLDKLENSSGNRRYLYDTTNKQPSEIINDLINRFEQFQLPKN